MSDEPTKDRSGTEPSRMFFDAYPRFLETSRTAAQRTRLNLRHEAIIQANRDILDGARVLDIASHDGRWSFAALKEGARHVTGVEARSRLVDQARETVSEYGIKRREYEFIAGDVFDVLARKSLKVDVVFCLGFLYHTIRYPELLSAIRLLRPRHVVVDTKVAQHDEPAIALTVNDADVQSHATVDAYSHGKATLAGWPSLSAVTRMFEAYGFNLEHAYDWTDLLSRRPRGGMKDYLTGERVTLRFHSA